MNKRNILLAIMLTLAVSGFAQKAGDKITFSSVDLNGNTVTDKLFAENKITFCS